MLIINADDWGRSMQETEAALVCHQDARITAVSAMVFMAGSERAAQLAGEHHIDAGLHLNLSENFDQPGVPPDVAADHRRIVRFMLSSRFAILLYHPGLRGSFRRTFNAQWNEFIRLYGRPPTHIDGHQHRHLCMNMLFDRIVPAGLALRRNFTYARTERGLCNRAYRRTFDSLLARHYRLTDFFFSLGEALRCGRMPRVLAAAKRGTVELMAHPVHTREREFLRSADFGLQLQNLQLGTFARA